MVQWFSGNSGENEKRGIPLKVFPFFRKIFSGKACSIWFPTGKTDFSTQMESAPAHMLTCSHAHMLTCSHVHHMSYHMSQLPVYWPWHAPAKIKWGGHFCVLTGMWVFQHITLHRATNSTKSQAKIRFAFHFVERNDVVKTKIITILPQHL